MQREAGVELCGRLLILGLVVDPGLLLASRACKTENHFDVSTEDKLDPQVPAFLPLSSLSKNDPQRVMAATAMVNYVPTLLG